MIQIKNFLIKREQSQACLSFAKREKSRLLAKTILTLVALLALTTQAWADGIVCTASDLGKVLCTDGSIYENVSAATTAGKTAVAMIAYVDETNKNGLAIGLSDEGKMDWSTAKSTCEDKPAVSGAAWLLPSLEQWRAMFKAFGGNNRSYTGLNTAITTAEGTALQGNAYYWSLTDEGGDNAYAVYLVEGSGDADWYDDSKSGSLRVRACLAFDIAPASSGPEVTFTASDLADGSSITKDGVTLTAYGQYGINMNGVNGPGEFTNSLGGNFTKIVVTADNLPSGDGWSAGTWTGSASSVSFTGNIESWKTEFTIVCTLETASSGPEVAWDKAKKTGTFTMPGGNVELEPEYYPQAALTAKPTAINDVPATTDGAIVNAGTVANIGETTNAQGTVMYYVSPTALDDAALLALAADQWTADVPTAESLTEGQAYVYYYVRGNDSDNDDENFSDGDILSANALTVIIAAAPTYAVTFAEGTDPNEWTASPNADVTKGETVTVTYSGTKKVIGVKATSDATPAEEPVTLATPLTIEALTAGTIVIQSPKVGMQYSLNGGTKTAATTDDINLAVQAGDKVQFYGNGTEISNYNDTRILGTGTGFTCNVYGNIMSLIDETGFATNKTLTSNNVFKQLFYANDALKDASGLLLPAETLTSSCYYSMFQICTNLVTGPDLPATTLMNDCYRQMFFGCSSLTAAPDLPATLLSSYCYYGMFNGCSSLTAAPDLPAPALVSNCYRQMFQNCSKLASVKCLATSPGNATNSWLNGAGSQVTGDKYFYAVSTASWTENSDSGIPVGWTRVNIDN